MQTTDYTDHHADESASVDDTRIRVEESSSGITIIKERYALTKYDAPERYFDWFDDDEFDIRADNIRYLESGLEEVDVDELVASLEQLQQLEDTLPGGSDAGD
jgi:hypothetical protein